MLTTIVLTLSLFALAQDAPSEARIHKMLVDKARACLEQKDDPRAVVRGAWLATRYRLVETQDLLLARLKHEGKWMNEWDWAQHSLLDAIIQNHLQVPRDLLLALARRGFVSEAVILLSSSPRGKKETRAKIRALFTLLQELEDPPAHAWQAVGNLLVLKKDPTIVSMLLEKISVSRQVFVSNHRRYLRTYGGGQRSTMWIRPKGFPPLVLYTIEVDPSPGDVLLAQGPTAIFYRRIVIHKSRFCIGSSSELIRTRDEYKLAWLYALGEKERPSQELPADKGMNVDFQGYASACAHERDMALAAWKDLFAALSKMGIHKGKTPTLRIRWRIRDMRKDKTRRLPSLPWMQEVQVNRDKR